MSRLRLFLSKYGLDALIVVAAVWGAAGTALREDRYHQTGMTSWFEVVVQARIGLAIVLGSSAILVHNDPTESAGGLVFVPVLFAMCWLVGYALRERTAQTEAAEELWNVGGPSQSCAIRVANSAVSGR